jgi:Icc-related predicted phosphoesterase
MTKIVAISDTHTQHSSLEIPKCDLLIHAGDFSYTGKMVDVIEMDIWFGKLKEKGTIQEAVLICGNHDWIGATNPSWTKAAFTNCIYLDEESCEVFGLKVFGSAWTPEFCNWAFNAKRGEEIARHWAKIPDDTQILVTHGPPMGILDINTEEIYSLPLGPYHLGCEELRKRVDELKELKLHVFGHIHSSNGQFKDPSGKLFVNAAICDESYQPSQLPQVITL